jgi:hypothetical protein
MQNSASIFRRLARAEAAMIAAVMPQAAARPDPAPEAPAPKPLTFTLADVLAVSR